MFTFRMLCLLAAGVTLLQGSAQGQTRTFTFDDIASLNDYASDGVTFQQNIKMWGPRNDSVLDDPDNGPLSPPYGICVGNCGGEAGSIFFATPQSFVSIWALSGPGPDLLSVDTRIRAKDGSGTILGEVTADTSLQFDYLAIAAPGIVELELFSPSAINEAWDHLAISGLDLVLQVSDETVVEGQGVAFEIAQGPVGRLAMLAIAAVNGSPSFLPISTGTYDSGGRYSVRSAVPVGVTGLDADFLGIGFDLSGQVVLTNQINVVFQ